ncbi:hypothetical protein BHS06_20210 [Myxococcus xanthus]|nr:hypothetical protein BHS06_20210 [Myxococcus xanthus]
MMSTQDDRYPQGSFGASPEYGARFAELTNALIPGGRGLVQQLFRAKQEALKGVAQILDAQIHELQHIDAAIEDRAKQAHTAPAAGQPHRSGVSFNDVLQKAGDLILAKRPKGTTGSEAGARPSDRRAPPESAPSPDSSSPAAASSSAPEPLEKISIS